MKNITEVVAALIWRGDKFLICRRPENKARALLWEFVGGKVEEGESKREALIRECFEELELNVETDGVFMEVEHAYPDLTIRLTLIKCHICGGEPKLKEHKELCWITKDEIDNFNFCPADEQFLKEIKKQN